ncbi:cytochrome P450 [Frankia sp. Cppng1_Ct_nod]|uniref:cytochrome P450 n=1 Tax=Frankia sp. Cppng1_Ct_nod TaxID=2897162 RepID=UPI001A9418BF|nr:cytochrome P450 [Frankia sp. Cppng1_Ct_nod]
METGPVVTPSDALAPPTREFFLPELPRSLPFAYHPQAAQIEFASNGWVREQLGECFATEGDLLFFLRQRNGIYGPLTVPNADGQRARDIADWYQYVTVIDSFVSDRSALGASDIGAREVFADILADFRGEDGRDSRAGDFAYGRAARDLWRRISPGLSPAQVSRFTAGLEAFLRGCATEIHSKLADSVPDYETCLAVRLDSFGCDFIELMTEYGADVDMSDVLPQLTEVHHHCRRQMIVINDLLSWRKEHSQDDRMTVVRVLIERDGLGLQDAVNRLCELVAQHEKAYAEARDALLSGPLGERGDVRTYLTAVDHLMGGSQEFEYLTPRYFGDGSVWDGSTSGWVDLDAPVTRFRPQPRPAGTAGEPAPTFVTIAAAATTVQAATVPGCPVPHAAATAAPGAGASGIAPDQAPPPTARRGTDGNTYSFAAAPGNLPVIGHALQLWRRPLQFLAGLPAQGDLVQIKLGSRNAYLACHPEVVTQVLVDSRTFDKGGPLFEKARLLVGNGLVSSMREDHRQQRRMLQPAFHPSRMPGYVQLMREEIADVLESWEDGRPIDVSDAMHALTLRITARTMFATTVGERPIIPEVAYCMPIIMRGVYKRMVAPIGWQEKIPTPGNRRFDQVRTRMHNIIKETIEFQRRAGTDHGDLLSILVAARDEETWHQLTDEEVYDQVMTLLIGGTETTGNTMAWAFHVLAEHPEVETRLHAEVDEVLGGRAPTFDDLPRLDYTWRVLHETLRMYPPAWLLTRTTTRETELAGQRLAEGAIVMYSPYAMGHNGTLFTDPERFDPDRWLPERARDIPRGAMVPFSAGSRKCIGDTFGRAETTLTLATIAARWSLRPIPGAKPHTAVPKASLGTGPYPMIPKSRAVAVAGTDLVRSGAG